MMTLAGRIRRNLPHLGFVFRKSNQADAPDAVLQDIALSDSSQMSSSSEHLSLALDIDCPEPLGDHDLCRAYEEEGRAFARQEDWAGLATRMADLDRDRIRTPSGKSAVALLALGARSDTVAAVYEALARNIRLSGAVMTQGTHGLSVVLKAFPQNPYAIALVAATHDDIAQALRVAVEYEFGQADLETAASTHADKAVELVSKLDPAQLDAPFIAALCFNILAERAKGAEDILALHETWHDLDPRDPDCLRALGRQMDPVRFDATFLDRAARQIAGQTCDVWGAGGYVWVMMDAVVLWPEAAEALDSRLFKDGISDIMRLTSDQYHANTLLAYCTTRIERRKTGSETADLILFDLAQSARQIARKHLTEVHPLVWAEALNEFAPTTIRLQPDRASAAGYAEALLVLSALFRNDLRNGKPVLFSRPTFDHPALA